MAEKVLGNMFKQHKMERNTAKISVTRQANAISKRADSMVGEEV